MMVRDFIYLDSGRMYSLYSQVFEGVADDLTKTFYNRLTTNNESKKSIFGETAKSSAEELQIEIESRIMYDNLYNKLEKKLDSVITVLDSSIKKPDLQDINNKFIVKVTGKALVQDYTRIADVNSNFNRLGEVISTSIYNKLNKSEKKATSIKGLAEERGLYKNPQHFKDLNFVSDLFSNNSFNIMIDPQIQDSNIIFNGVLNRKFLRIDENRLRHLYTNKPIIPWIMVGQVTYIQNILEDISQDLNKINETNLNTGNAMADTYINMVTATNDLEKVYMDSKIYNKVHIAPISIYVEQDLELK